MQSFVPVSATFHGLLRHALGTARLQFTTFLPFSFPSPKRSLERNRTTPYRKESFLSFLMGSASSLSFVLDVTHYDFEPTIHRLLYNPIKSIEALTTILG